MTTIAIIQARMTSSRLPGKVLADLAGRPLLAYMISRVRLAERLDGICVATTVNATDDPVANLCQDLGVPVFRGDEMDVLGRYAAAAKAEADIIVRLTADCPMIDPTLIDQAIGMFSDGAYDYLSNSIHLSYPDGLDVEVFTRAALDTANREATEVFHREHVTPYMRTGIYPDLAAGDFKVGNMTAPADFSHLRWTVDNAEDLERVRRLVVALPPDFGWLEAVSLLTRRPDLFDGNAIEAPDVRLRPATNDDAECLYQWVNRPDSLANKLKTHDPISHDSHCAWFRESQVSADTGIWIAECDGAAVGQVRLDHRDRALEVDIYVDQQARGKGIALAMLDAARVCAATRWPETPLVARIRPDNWASRRLFAKAGYGSVTVAPDHLIYRLKPTQSAAGQ